MSRTSTISDDRIYVCFIILLMKHIPFHFYRYIHHGVRTACIYSFIYSLALHSGACFASHWRVRRKVSTASSCQPLDWKQIASAHCFEPPNAERSPRKACWANCEARTISLVDENLTGWDHRWILLKADKKWWNEWW